MRFHIKAVHWSLGVLLIATLLFSAQAFPQSNDNPEVTKLLQNGREKEADIARDADNMESLIRTDASWQTHAAMLDNIKEHVNDLGRIAQRLESLRGSASPWQQQAIDRMLPVLKELAAHTTAAINHLNENKTRPTIGSYPEYLRANAEAAHDLADMISAFAQYGQARSRLERLEQKLEVASK